MVFWLLNCQKHVEKSLESTLKPINSLKDFRAQKKEFLLGFDRSNSISFLNYWPYAHSKTICYHIINHTFVLTKVLPKPYRYVSNNWLVFIEKWLVVSTASHNPYPNRFPKIGCFCDRNRQTIGCWNRFEIGLAFFGCNVEKKRNDFWKSVMECRWVV